MSGQPRRPPPEGLPVSARRMAMVWCAALVLALTTVIALGRAAPTSTPLPATVPNAPVVVIGSSLIAYAVPPGGETGTSLLGDGRDHARLAIGSLSEAQALALFERALQGGSRTVFIEAHPLAFDHAYRTPVRDRQPKAWAVDLLDESRRALAGWHRVLHSRPARGVPVDSAVAEVSWHPEPAGLDDGFRVSRGALKMFYPLHLRAPEHRQGWIDHIAFARRNGVQVILVAPPRSQTAAQALGAEASSALQVHLASLAQDLGVPLFQPGPVWPDDCFIDTAHMSRHGRTRFMRELARWWANQT